MEGCTGEKCHETLKYRQYSTEQGKNKLDISTPEELKTWIYTTLLLYQLKKWNDQTAGPKKRTPPGTEGFRI